MQEPTYPAAREAVPGVLACFERHQEASRARGAPPVAALPSQAVVETIVSAAFWASLRREEGYEPRVSLAYLPPEQAEYPMCFERPMPLAADRLARVAPAVERAGIHLGIWDAGDGLVAWGATRRVPSLCFVLEIAAPGVLVVKHHRADESGKFFNVATLEGDQVKVIDERAAGLRTGSTVVSSLLGAAGAAGPGALPGVDVLVELAVSMRAHGRGGALLVVPVGDGAWLESIVPPVSYAVSPPFVHLATLIGVEPGAAARAAWRTEVRRTVEAVAGVTAVDGATIVTPEYELVAFGAKITKRHGQEAVERVLLTEPIHGHPAEVVDTSRLGGTRHLSAAQFVHDQRDALALVASQDGRFTIFGWSTVTQQVQAHRVEALLL